MSDALRGFREAIGIAGYDARRARLDSAGACSCGRREPWSADRIRGFLIGSTAAGHDEALASARRVAAQAIEQARANGAPNLDLEAMLAASYRLELLDMTFLEPATEVN